MKQLCNIYLIGDSAVLASSDLSVAGYWIINGVAETVHPVEPLALCGACVRCLEASRTEVAADARGGLPIPEDLKQLGLTSWRKVTGLAQFFIIQRDADELILYTHKVKSGGFVGVSESIYKLDQLSSIIKDILNYSRSAGV